MSINKTNLDTYTSNDGLSTYIDTSLQSPEVSIFVKYKDSYYGKSILDIGCGAGRTSFYFRNFTKEYVGVDYSEAMINYCKNQYSELTFKHVDARDLGEFTSNSFDFVIFSYNGIDYITNEDRIKVFKEIKRVLKDDGTFVFSTHNRDFKDIILKPIFEISLNPINFTRNLFNYFKQIKTNNKLKNKQIEKDEYAILNDSGNSFSLLTYYITKEKQLTQLNKVGFETLEIFNMSGETHADAADDSNEAWLYFVTKKITS